MKRGFLLYFTVLSAISSFAQKGIDGLIQAETKFAALSVASGVKDAFLANMDSSSLVFDKGKATPGIPVWQAREKRKIILNWHPEYAEISASNDFGYTTGPWTVNLPGTDTTIASGYYSTVWHFNREGKWTFLVDLGTDNVPPSRKSGITKITVDKNSVSDTSAFINTEKEFIRLFNQDSGAAYTKYLSANSLVNRHKYSPAVSVSEQQRIIKATSPAIQYTIDGWVMSPGRDMACVYGSTVLNGNNDNYMRVWRHEKDGWKIALEVLHH